MNVLPNRVLAVFLALTAAGCLAAGFLPDVSPFPLLSVAVTAAFLLAALGKEGAACLAAGAVSAGAFVLLGRTPASFHPAVAASLGALWASLAALHARRQAADEDHRRDQRTREDTETRARSLESEIRFYEERRVQLADRAEKRRRLSEAARRLGSLLDPAQVQEKLIEAARQMFPGHVAEISYGAHSDRVDAMVAQRRQSVLVPSDALTGPPLIAVPVVAQQNVAAVLRVRGADAAHPYNRDDMRLLDALASLASVALDNCVLFHQVQQSALRDNLTGLLTHRAFQDQIDSALLEASRYHQPLSLLFGDVDHFKSVNDTHGHPAGDQVLQGFAHILDRNVRDVDIVARYGGEEFAIILLQTDHDAALRVAEQIRLDFAEQVFELDNGDLRATVSFGVATFPTDATSSQQLVREADQRVYAAKRGGRNRVVGRSGR